MLRSVETEEECPPDTKFRLFNYYFLNNLNSKKIMQNRTYLDAVNPGPWRHQCQNSGYQVYKDVWRIRFVTACLP